MQDFEKLGVFYLGREYDVDRGAAKEDLLLYDSRDLTTHAVCVGMTGSGKTGLCLALLEEAAIDGIPAIAIDPKGDLADLLLTFPQLRAGDFRPWVDPDEAARRGQSPDDYAASVADKWRAGLAEWGMDGARIGRFRDSVDLALYTPGSSAGLPLSVLRSFAAPPPALRGDAEAMRERASASVSGLLGLVGVEADPLRSREHILLAAILDGAWREGRDLDLADLIRAIQSPGFERVGVMDLESFFPAKERFGLAMLLNNLLASPGFSAWSEGEPLDVGRLLTTPEGKPRLSILSIAHLSDAERMFFVTLLMNEVVAWMRGQPGTGSLRALLYMDEVAGYLPPVAAPPSKGPLLTLLKQARAFGVGVVLATQNPVDLDYKALSNAGTWFLGRLQTERDKARVLDGLEGATAVAGRALDRETTERTLSALSNRVFLMHNVHEDSPVVFQSRWALSYLRGPLTRSQIQTLVAARKEAPAPAAARQDAVGAAPAPAAGGGGERPVLPPDVPQLHVAASKAPAGEPLLYRPMFLATARLHYVNAQAGLDQWRTSACLAPLPEPGAALDPAQATWLEGGPPPAEEPRAGSRYEPPPAAAALARSYASWQKSVKDYLYSECPLTLWRCGEPKAVSKPGEAEGDFRARLALMARERRDAEVERLRARYAPKLASLQERIRRAQERVDREEAQYGQQKVQTAISVGATFLGALLGRKAMSTGTVGRASTAMRGASRTLGEKQDVERARAEVGELSAELERLEAESRESASALQAQDSGPLILEEVKVAPRKSDLAVGNAALAWVPWRERGGGLPEPAY